MKRSFEIPSLYHVKTSLFELIQAENEVSIFEAVGECSTAHMTKEDSQTEVQRVLRAPFDLVANTSESTQAKTAETFLELLGARVRNPNIREALIG